MPARRARSQGINGFLQDVLGPVSKTVQTTMRLSAKAEAKLPTETRLCPCCSQKLSRHTKGPYCLRCSRWCQKCNNGRG